MFCSLESPVTQDCPAPEQFWMHWHGPSSSGCLQWSSNANSWYLWYFLAAWVSFYLYVMGMIKRDHLFRREMQFHCWLQCCSSLESFLTALWHIQKSVLPGFWETSSLLHAAPGNGSLPFSSAVFSLTMAVTMLGNKIRVYQRGFTLSMTGTRQTWAITSHRWFFSLKIRPHNMSVLKDQYRLCLEKAFQQEKQHYNTFFFFPSTFPSTTSLAKTYFPVFLQAACPACVHSRHCSEMIFPGFADVISTQLAPLCFPSLGLH